eukprot:1513725-Pyramimonas_sp.AAC.1
MADAVEDCNPRREARFADNLQAFGGRRAKLATGALPIRNGHDGPPLQSNMEVANSVQDFFATIEGITTLTPTQMCEVQSI